MSEPTAVEVLTVPKRLDSEEAQMALEHVRALLKKQELVHELLEKEEETAQKDEKLVDALLDQQHSD